MDNVDSLISEHTKAVLLLTAYFNANESRDVKPLTENGYGYFARWLNFHDYKPVDLLDQARFAEICIRWEQSESHLPVKKQVMLRSLDRTIADITVPRLQSLLNRGASMSMALDKWSAAGIWILDRSHDLYPGTIKKKLKDKAPAILFGVGNPALLAKNSVGFVGSRDCQQNDLDATDHYVQQINDAGFQVVSGAAKGIDSHAMLASLNSGNSAVGIVADSLFKNSASSQWRNHLKNGKLALISPFFPESRFSPANAMQRNKYIYLLSQATVVVCSSVSGQGKKSGTWEGAIENLKNNWVPLLVSDHKHPNHAGNQSLLNEGIPKLQSVAQPITLSDTAGSISALITGNHSNHIGSIGSTIEPDARQVNLFESTGGEASALQSVQDIASQDEPLAQGLTPDLNVSDEISSQGAPDIPADTADTKSDIQMDFITDTHNKRPDDEDVANTNDQGTLTSKQKDLLAMSLIGRFYEQLGSIYKQHIEQTGQVYIEFSLIEQNFPEFQLLGKSALDKLLKELVDHNLLARLSPRKKLFCFPDHDTLLSRQTAPRKQERHTGLHPNK